MLHAVQICGTCASTVTIRTQRILQKRHYKHIFCLQKESSATFNLTSNHGGVLQILTCSLLLLKVWQCQVEKGRAGLPPSMPLCLSLVEPMSTQNLSKATSTVSGAFENSRPEELNQPSCALRETLFKMDGVFHHVLFHAVAVCSLEMRV